MKKSVQNLEKKASKTEDIAKRVMKKPAIQKNASRKLKLKKATIVGIKISMN